MAKRPKYHFLTVIETRSGTCMVALPGQSFGRNSVPERIMVQDIGESTIISRARKKASPGEIFFTTSLQLSTHSLKARDIYPLNADNGITLSDAPAEFDKYIKSLAKEQ